MKEITEQESPKYNSMCLKYNEWIRKRVMAAIFRTSSPRPSWEDIIAFWCPLNHHNPRELIYILRDAHCSPPSRHGIS